MKRLENILTVTTFFTNTFKENLLRGKYVRNGGKIGV
jgi:hypothetical protein